MGSDLFRLTMTDLLWETGGTQTACEVGFSDGPGCEDLEPLEDDFEDLVGVGGYTWMPHMSLDCMSSSFNCCWSGSGPLREIPNERIASNSVADWGCRLCKKVEITFTKIRRIYCNTVCCMHRLKTLRIWQHNYVLQRSWMIPMIP